MIVRMIKYTFAVHHRFYRQFLDDLQEIEVVHIERSKDQKVAGEAAELTSEVVRINQLLEQFKNYTHDEPKQDTCTLSVNETDNLNTALTKRLSDCRSALEQLQETIDARQIWGDYSDQLVAELQSEGIRLRFFTMPTKKFSSSWLEIFPIEIISRSDREIHFVWFGTGDIIFEGARELHPPHEQMSDLIKRSGQLKKEISEIRSELEHLANDSWVPLHKRLETLRDRLEWLDIMDNQTSRIGEGQIYLLEGWVPVTSGDKLNQYLEEKGILYFQSEATGEETPPVQLKNNRFARLFEPISLLFSLPSYGELDLTAFFAPFFMLFFGFCLGDAGYGIIIFLGCTIGKQFVTKEVRSYLTLGQFFGISTMVMGMIFGTFFGVVLAEIPAFDRVKGLFLDTSTIFNLSLIIGGVQIIFGIMIRMFNQLRQGTPSVALGSFGWLMLFFTAGLFEYVLADAELVPVLKILRIALYTASLICILFFSGTGSILQRFGGGIWEIYGNVTGIFGDLLSYIRLFALGVASSILGLVVNQMAVAFGKAPYIGPVIFLLVIVIGHAANLVISSLGSFVHPMRLTFVEFYKNAGFKGGGKSYRPFARQKKHLSI